MNDEAKQKLNDILGKDIKTLSADDKAFLQARRSYLTPTQKNDFKDALVEEKEEAKPPVKETVNKDATPKTK